MAPFPLDRIPDLPVDLLIGGKAVPASDGGRFDVVDPATGEGLTAVAHGTLDDAIAAVDAADAAAAGWAATAPRERAEILRRTFELMTARADELAHLISLENGKALVDARGEVTYAAEFFRWYAEEAVRAEGTVATAPSGANRILVVRQPVGVCVLVTPWNFPAAMATRKIGPAIAAGCTAILKPAAETPPTAIAVAGILTEAGLPDGVLNLVVTTRARDIVGLLMRSPAVRMVSFTGSTEVGRPLLTQAASSVMRTAMELVRNAPFLVLDDADLDAALDGAIIAKMRNGGHACTAANRFYAQAGIHDRFVDGLVERMSAVRVGPGTDAANECGPLITAKSVAKVQELVDDAVARGATVRLGGAPLPGAGTFYPPTVLADVPADARILREEVFGPVAPVARFEEVEDAVAAANDVEHGLVSYLYTSDLA